MTELEEKANSVYIFDTIEYKEVKYSGYQIEKIKSMYPEEKEMAKGGSKGGKKGGRKGAGGKK